MVDVLVYSAVFGKYDEIREPREPGHYRLITDGRAPWPWQEQHEPPTRTPRRTARYWKTAGMPTDHKFTLWIDGNIELIGDPERIVQKWLVETRADIALFQHPGHDCIFTEARICKSKRKEFPEIVDAQMERYNAKGLPLHFDLGETTVLARRVNAAVDWFNRQWWYEIQQGSARDQLSFDYVRWLMGDAIKVKFINGGHAWKRREHEWFRGGPHRRKENGRPD